VAKWYRPVDRDQAFLLPPSMTDWLPEDHLVWFVIEAVGQLDTTAFHAKARLGGAGRRGYHPDMLLTLLVYAMAHGVRSSRQIERLCHSDVAFRIICAGDSPDHSVLARFRQQHETALAGLLTETLLLAARMGMVRLGVVAFDGTKIAGNAARNANREEEALRRLAEQHLMQAAATDEAEDAEYGPDRGDELPPDLRDRSGRSRRIRQALDEIAVQQAEQQARDEAARRQAEDYLQRLADPDTPVTGPRPKAVTAVDAAYARWQAERARVQRRFDAWHARAAQARAAGRGPSGAAPVPVDQHCRVRKARTAYDAALTAAETAAATPADAATSQNSKNTRPKTPRANLSDPESRLLKTRTGYLQGYNCQTAVSEDHFFLHATATQDPNDLRQYENTQTAVTGIAAALNAHTSRTDLTVGVMLGDAGYDSDHNLTLPGPDRLIATSRERPHPDAVARRDMDQRLATPEGRDLYKHRSGTVEPGNAWLKDRRGLRQFLRRGLTAATSELRLAAAVTNLLRLRQLGITTTHLATR
jgi:transposase